jgi:hypothetical protein
MSKENNYHKLRPYTEIESCECKQHESVLLVDLLTDNPIHCLECKREIHPELLNLSNEMVETIYTWKSLHNSLYLLWLDSGEYEFWAKEELLDKKSRVNILGLEVIQKLSATIPTYLWWFWDTDDGNAQKCPVCDQALDTNTKYGEGKCDKCQIYI